MKRVATFREAKFKTAKYLFLLRLSKILRLKAQNDDLGFIVMIVNKKSSNDNCHTEALAEVSQFLSFSQDFWSFQGLRMIASGDVRRLC